MSTILVSIVLLLFANVFMTFAWYGHLSVLGDKPVWLAIVISWGIAFFEYCLQVPANRLGYGTLDLPQLKITQEVITMVVFMGFSRFFMKKPLTLDLVYASACLALAAYFVFRGEGTPKIG